MAISPAVERLARRLGVSVDFDGALNDVDDPVVGDTSARIETRFVLAVDLVRALGDFYDQDGPRGVRVQIHTWIVGDHADVGLGLRIVIERERKLRVDLPRVAERPA